MSSRESIGVVKLIVCFGGTSAMLGNHVRLKASEAPSLFLDPERLLLLSVGPAGHPTDW